MPLRQVHLREDSFLEVDGAGAVTLEEEGEGFVGPIEVIETAGLTSLRLALSKYADARPRTPSSGVNPRTGEKLFIKQEPKPFLTRVQIVNVPPSKFAERHSYEFLPEPIEIVLRESGELAVLVEFVVKGECEPDPNQWNEVLNPLLQRTNSTIDGIDVFPEGPYDFRTSFVVADADFSVVNLYLTVPTRGRDVASAIAIGRDALLIVEATENGAFGLGVAQSFVEAGRADLLVGQAEASWLECKGQPYQNTDHGRLEFAKDVTAFANTGTGGSILIGLRTKARAGRDVITDVRAVNTDDRLPDRYRKWISQWVFPRPVDIRIRNIPCGATTSVVSISIPPQPRGLMPFLVKGVLREGRITGTHIAIFHRQDDVIVPTGIEELHSLLVAGRAALGYEQHLTNPDS
jgi:hypothetical protein